MTKPKSEQTTTQIIAREGVKPIALSAVCMFVFIFLHLNILALAFLMLGLFFAFVFRNPERIAQSRANDAIIAPCDGMIKDIIATSESTIIRVKIGAFDSGILRSPVVISRLGAKFRYGLFLREEIVLKKILNTKHRIEGFCGDKIAYNITLFPEVWNKVNIYERESTIAGDRIGFMKYGYLELCIYAHCNIEAQKGQNIFAGETLLGRLYED